VWLRGSSFEDIQLPAPDTRVQVACEKPRKGRIDTFFEPENQVIRAVRSGKGSRYGRAVACIDPASNDDYLSRAEQALCHLRRLVTVNVKKATDLDFAVFDVGCPHEWNGLLGRPQDRWRGPGAVTDPSVTHHQARKVNGRVGSGFKPI